MSDWSSAGKLIVFIGFLLMLIGGLITLLGRLSGEGGLVWFGKLPGDILIKRDSFSLYFPLTTSIVVSVIISLVAYLVSFLKR